jgi:DNA-binding transcriptional ArsR family regulator/TusA-related sulfurtransferase
MDADSAAPRFALLADPTRLRIVATMVAHGEVSVGALARAAGTSSFNASAHLARLAASGLVQRRRMGTKVFYRIDRSRLSEIHRSITELLESRPAEGGEEEEMAMTVFDVRKATCPRGGAIWVVLSHIRDLARGGAFELITDDDLALDDISRWADKMRWPVRVASADGGGRRFLVRRPA